MNKKDRSVRRHHIARLKKKRAGYWGLPKELRSPRILGILASTPKPCSCFMCSDKCEPTYQEKKLSQVDLIEET